MFQVVFPFTLFSRHIPSGFSLVPTFSIVSVARRLAFAGLKLKSTGRSAIQGQPNPQWSAQVWHHPTLDCAKHQIPERQALLLKSLLRATHVSATKGLGSLLESCPSGQYPAAQVYSCVTEDQMLPGLCCPSAGCTASGLSFGGKRQERDTPPMRFSPFFTCFRISPR